MSRWWALGLIHQLFWFRNKFGLKPYLCVFHKDSGIYQYFLMCSYPVFVGSLSRTNLRKFLLVKEAHLIEMITWSLKINRSLKEKNMHLLRWKKSLSVIELEFLPHDKVGMFRFMFVVSFFLCPVATLCVPSSSICCLTFMRLLIYLAWCHIFCGRELALRRIA